MKGFRKTMICISFLLSGLLCQLANGQSILDPNDPVLTYNPSSMPVQPALGQIGKWVRTSRVSWNTASYKAYIYKGIAFRLKFPRSYNPGSVNDNKRYPMLVCFHGAGERGSIYDNEYSLYHGAEKFKDAADTGTFDGFVLVMQSTAGWGTRHFAALKELIDYMVVNNKLSPFQVSVTGFSAGGSTCWEFMDAYPSLAAQVIPISGISVRYGAAERVEKFKFTPVWYFQGGLDNAPSPYTAQAVKDKIDSAGGNLEYKEYPHLGHACWDTAWAEPVFFPSLNSAYSSNPFTLFKKTEFALNETIDITVGVAPGFDEYEWRKDGKVLASASGNKIRVRETGVYDARVRRDTIWSEWSRVPVLVKSGGL